VQSVGYWSATSQGTTSALDVNFSIADVSSSAKSSGLVVWCVRGGHGVDSW
jgi:hypothetical protein